MVIFLWHARTYDISDFPSYLLGSIFSKKILYMSGNPPPFFCQVVKIHHKFFLTRVMGAECVENLMFILNDRFNASILFSPKCHPGDM
jgi:hypothetical protein